MLPACCSANCSTFYQVEIPSQLAKQTHVDSQNFDAIIREPCRAMQLLRFCFCPKMASQAISEHLFSKNFIGEHAPRPPYFLSCLCIHITPLLKILATTGKLYHSSSIAVFMQVLHLMNWCRASSHIFFNGSLYGRNKMSVTFINIECTTGK